MTNDPNQPNQPGWRFDPQTGQPVNPPSQPEQVTRRFDPQTGQPIEPSHPVQPQQPAYTPPAYTPPVYTPPAYTPPEPQQAPTQPYTPPYTAAQQPVQSYAPPTQVNIAPPKKRRGGCLLAALIVVLLLLVGGGVGGYLLYTNVINRPAVAVERVLPANVLGYISINPALSGTQKASMDKLKDAFQSQPGFKDAWDRIIAQASEMSGAVGVATPATTPGAGDFDTISQYLGGNVTIAMLPPSTDDLQKLKDASSNGNLEQVAGDVLGRSVVGMVDLDFNPLNKKGVLSDFKQQADNSSKLELAETYRGMDIRKYITGTQTLYFTLLDGSSTAVLGEQVAPLKLVMDQYKDNTGLKDDANFKSLSGQVPADRIATLYLNLKQIYTEIGLVEPDAAQQVQSVDGAAMFTLSAHDDGMQVDVASQVDFSNSTLGSASVLQVNPQEKPDVATLSDIPSNSLGFVVGTDLQSVIKSALDAASKQGGDTQTNIQSTEDQFKQDTNLDLMSDILPLLSSDYIVSVTPGNLSSDGSGSPASAVVVQIKLKQGQGSKAQSVVGSLAQYIGKQGEGDVKPEQFSAGGGTFYKVKDPNSSTSYAFGATGDRIIALVELDGSEPANSVNSVLSGLGKGLGSTDTWKGASKHLPIDSNIIAYVDFTGIRTLAENSLDSDTKQQYEQNYAPFVRPLKYLLVGSATQTRRQANLSLNHTVVFFGISK